MQKAHRRAIGAAAAVIVTLSSWVTQAHADNGVRNLQAPVDLQWHALGVLETPGLGGLRAGATYYVPVVPLYVGVEGARVWGVDPSHPNGARSGFITRGLTGTLTLEARLGVSFAAWGSKNEHSAYDYDYSSKYNYRTGRMETSYSEDQFAISPPVYRRVSAYAGYRARSNPGHTACPVGDATLPADCAETGQGFLMAGIELLAAQHVKFGTAKWGALESEYTETWDFRLLFSSRNAYARDSVARRIGAEVGYTIVKSGIGIAIRAGWDGENALVSLGMGGGASHSIFDGHAPNGRELRQR
jgi:hypothetical protein